MTILEEKELRIESGEIACTLLMKKLGLTVDEISQREAYRLYDESKVRSWVNAGYVRKIKVGEKNSKVTYSRIELDTVKRLCENRKLK